MKSAKVLFRPPSEELRFLPEGPYPVGNSKISWVAIQHGAAGTIGSLNLYDFGTKRNESFPLPGRPGFAFPCDDDQSFVVGCERSLGLFCPLDGSWKVLCTGIDAEVQGTIINDAVVWEQFLVFGCKDLKFEDPKAGLYLWDTQSQKLTQLRCDQTCSNGKAIRCRPGGSLELLDIDTPTKQVAAYDFDPLLGKLSDRRVALDLRDQVGFPDGAILSPDESAMIISFYNPEPAEFGETRMYDLQSGRVLEVWRTPGSPQATCPQLIENSKGVQLVITTAVEHMPTERRAGAPEAGSLFIAETDFSRATPAPKFPIRKPL